ncbi:ABC transporter ATP-binding protein [Halosimplex pelagicum]|uniref:Nickel import system ATP-binding protein NikD n=1 Tax=Halosimplex pelagicum TaxID=869886 RepID=A0A7D5TBE5_9EURY|nr:ABC transporter ATP-binding protein [Halosimplex pelagicum]QLH82009.1 ABC transporter ATP-binding protein [Halosimplex pelagicum]
MSIRSDNSPRSDRPEEDAIIEVRDASVEFDMDRGRSRVMNDVSLNIQREEILGVVGESGCGKSMFASAMLDAIVEPGLLTGQVIYRPENGEAVDLVDLPDDELDELRWEEISMCFQGAMNSFNPTMKIGAHFAETARAHNRDVDERMEHARDLLKELYLDPERILDSYAHELSGGMTQRALIALSLLLEPEVLVMDEPTAALDLLMQRSIISLLSKIKEEHDLTVIFITHDLPLVTGFVDRLAVMYAFEIVEVGPSSQVVKEASHPYTRALLRSVPSLDAPLEEMHPIEGESPDPVNIPTGCSYHTRCPIADERCEIEEPELIETNADQEAACFYWEQAQDEVTYTLHSGIMGDDE